MAHRIHADGPGGRAVVDGGLDHLAVVGVHAVELVRLAIVGLLHLCAAGKAARAQDDRLGVDGDLCAVRLLGEHAHGAVAVHDERGRLGFQHVFSAHLREAVICGGKEALGELLVAGVGREDRPLAADKADRRVELEAVALQPVAGFAALVNDLADDLRLGALHAVDGRVAGPLGEERLGVNQLLAGGLGPHAVDGVLPLGDFRGNLARRVHAARAGGGCAGSAPLAGLVDGQHAHARLGGCQCGGRAGGAHADDEHIRVIGFLGVLFGNRHVQRGDVRAGLLQRVRDAQPHADAGERRAGHRIYGQALGLNDPRKIDVLRRGDHAHRLPIFPDGHGRDGAVLDFNLDGNLHRQVEAAALTGISAVRQSDLRAGCRRHDDGQQQCQKQGSPFPHGIPPYTGTAPGF